MLRFSKRSNLLEQRDYHYTLQDVSEPNLYREIYRYDEVPKTPFNFRHVPMETPEEIWITDTSFRDGQQSQRPYSVKQIVDLYTLMARLGGPKGLIRQTEFFAYSQKDREAIERCKDLGLPFPEITTWIRASKDDFQLVKSLGIQETGILVSCSDYHIFKKLGKTRRQAMDLYLGTVKEAFAAGVRPRCHLEDITRADFYGFVLPFITELTELGKEAGLPIKIRACDTMGYGVNYPGVAIPRSVPGIVYGLKHYAGVPSELLEWHGHNDFYKGVVNAAAAWLYGASAVNCSLLGIGERTGNVPLEAMVMEYASLRGTFDGMDPTAITAIARYFRDEMDYDIPLMTPFVGESFNVTKAGIHADGMLKDEEIYNIFDTSTILARPSNVAITNLSGLAGLAFWVNGRYSLTGDAAIGKQSPLVAFMKQWVDQEYMGGRETVISTPELEALVDAFQPELAMTTQEDLEMDKDSGISLAEQVFETLENDILSGVYQTGTALTEKALADAMGVSRTPVREALRRLEQAGLLEMSPNKGVVVLGVTDRDLSDIYDIRMRIEGLAARLAATHGNHQQKTDLTDIVDLEAYYTQKGDVDQIKNMDSRFHRAIYDMTDSHQLTMTLSDMHHRIQRFRRQSLNRPERALLVAQEHRAICDAIAKGDADAAEAAMALHIANAKNSLLWNGSAS